jgi:hypothetical protein
MVCENRCVCPLVCTVAASTCPTPPLVLITKNLENTRNSLIPLASMYKSSQFSRDDGDSQKELGKGLTASQERSQV